MLTPKDIENPKRQSGYNYVNSASGGKGGHGNTSTFWRARVGFGGNHRNGPRFSGPSRTTALEAAHDYCDHMNGNTVGYTASLLTAGHAYSTPKIERDEEVEAALGVLRDHKAQRAGKQGYVYAITEDGCGEYVKLGYSVNPQKRVAELQTGNPRKLVLLGYREGTPADERALHAKYIKMNVLQEWFKLEPSMADEFNTKEVV